MKTFYRRIPLIFVALVTLNTAIAQEKYKPFKVDLSWGFVIPDGPGTRLGLLLVAEPKYAVMPSLSVGIRGEAAFGLREFTIKQEERQYDSELKRAASLLGTADYYLRPGRGFRPFVGGGAGLYVTRTEVETRADTKVVDINESMFGAMVRLGFEAWHFRLGAEYNFLPATVLPDHLNPGSFYNSNNGYFAIKAGFNIGGGRIKKKRRPWSESQ